jgi:hypothetical protein
MKRIAALVFAAVMLSAGSFAQTAPKPEPLTMETAHQLAPGAPVIWKQHTPDGIQQTPARVVRFTPKRVVIELDADHTQHHVSPQSITVR